MEPSSTSFTYEGRHEVPDEKIQWPDGQGVVWRLKYGNRDCRTSLLHHNPPSRPGTERCGIMDQSMNVGGGARGTAGDRGPA